MIYDALSLLFQFLDSFAFIVLATVGLAVIFGMMGIINLAHGEFILVGAYGTARACPSRSRWASASSRRPSSGSFSNAR